MSEKIDLERSETQPVLPNVPQVPDAPQTQASRIQMRYHVDGTEPVHVTLQSNSNGELKFFAQDKILSESLKNMTI
ncbi:hypothetical protein TNCT_225591 [Trichonephila clavata]|uniref:Uncharacterized protein n=1 Tax=Trichonephila clavata TaxID=2740835 RepID=A0A8X6L8E8_TRICU|nr:hypothetical protein TNCT_225591 [Trichonephila clavata]